MAMNDRVMPHIEHSCPLCIIEMQAGEILRLRESKKEINNRMLEIIPVTKNKSLTTSIDPLLSNSLK